MPHRQGFAEKDGPCRWRAVALSLLAAISFAAIDWAQHNLLHQLGLELAHATSWLSRPLAQLVSTTPPVLSMVVDRDRPRSGHRTAPLPHTAPTPSVAGTTPRTALTQRGILVSKARVLSAARSGLRPSGHPQQATPWRPAGLALSGVGAFGVGLQDGDILTRIGGTPAHSSTAVIGAVAGALRSSSPSITAEMWRQGQRFLLTVELPLLSETSLIAPGHPEATYARPGPQVGNTDATNALNKPAVKYRHRGTGSNNQQQQQLDRQIVTRAP